MLKYKHYPYKPFEFCIFILTQLLPDVATNLAKIKRYVFTHIPPPCNQRSSELGELRMALYLSICFSFHPENALRPYLQVGNGRAPLELGHEG